MAMNPDAATTAETLDPVRHPPGRWWRVLATTTCVVLGVGGLAGCTSDQRSESATTAPDSSLVLPTTRVTTPVVTIKVPPTPEPPTPEPGPTPEPDPSTTVAVTVEDACRPQTLPVADQNGVVNASEKICTWGPGLRAHLDDQGFVGPSQNHPIDLDMAERCWSADGRVYLRTPAVEGWACVGATS
jgi:hypothetical protein